MGQYNFVSPSAMAGNAIQEFLMRREEEQLRQQEMKYRREREEQERAFRERDMSLREKTAAAALERQSRLDAQADSDRALKRSREQDERGVLDMIDASMGGGPLTPDRAHAIARMAWRAGVPVPGIVDRAMQPPNRTVVTTTDAQGRPVRRVVTDEELATGVAEYRAPERPDHEWVVRGGQPIQIRKGTARAGDVPYDEVAARGGGGSEYSRFLARWAEGRGLDANRLTADQELEARRRWSEAGRDPLFGFDDDGDIFTEPAPVGGGAPSRGGGPGPSPRGARPPSTATSAEVAAVAQQLGISVAEAQRRLQAQGVAVR